MQAPLVAIVSQGCAANFGDGERIARLLAKKFRTLFNFPTDEIPEAIYLNVCTVKGNAGAIKLLKKAHETYPEARIYITGCAPADFRKEASAIFNKIEFTSGNLST